MFGKSKKEKKPSRCKVEAGSEAKGCSTRNSTKSETKNSTKATDKQ